MILDIQSGLCIRDAMLFFGNTMENEPSPLNRQQNSQTLEARPQILETIRPNTRRTEPNFGRSENKG